MKQQQANLRATIYVLSAFLVPVAAALAEDSPKWSAVLAASILSVLNALRAFLDQSQSRVAETTGADGGAVVVEEK